MVDVGLLLLVVLVFDCWVSDDDDCSNVVFVLLLWLDGVLANIEVRMFGADMFIKLLLLLFKLLFKLLLLFMLFPLTPTISPPPLLFSDWMDLDCFFFTIPISVFYIYPELLLFIYWLFLLFNFYVFYTCLVLLLLLLLLLHGEESTLHIFRFWFELYE